MSAIAPLSGESGSPCEEHRDAKDAHAFGQPQASEAQTQWLFILSIAAMAII
jgi:hypothetical protein